LRFCPLLSWTSLDTARQGIGLSCCYPQSDCIMTKVLTQRAVDAARPRAKRYGRPDGLVPGLSLIIQPSGFKSYSLFTRVGNEQVKLLVGNARILSLAQARDHARQLLVQIARGEDPRVKPVTSQPAVETVAAVVHNFVERYAKPRVRNWRVIERILKREVLPRWGSRPIGDVGKNDVIALLDSIIDRGAPVMANRVLAVVRRLFNWAIERGTVAHSPCERVKAPAREVARDRTPSDDELRQIWRAADGLGYPFGPCIQLLVLLGQRRAEVGAMRWSELNSELTSWVLPPSRTKNKRVHVIPISSAARAILQSVPRFVGSDFVFTTNGAKPVTGFAVAKAKIDRAIVPALAPWVLHDLRRSVASGLAAFGTQQPVVEKILNHVSGSFVGVAAVYQRYSYRSEMAEALEAWGAFVLTLVDPHYSGSQNAARRGRDLRAVQ
jgi:integrase